MDFAPITGSDLVIQVHTLASLLAFAIGPVAILRRRRDWLHRQAGHLWVAAMAVSAVTAMGIFEIRLIGPLSPIHALPFLVGFMLWRAIRAILTGDMVTHGRVMTQMYVWSMGVAGLFTLLPGRRMNAVLFGGDSWAGFAAVAVVMAALMAILWRAQPRAHFPLHKAETSG